MSSHKISHLLLRDLNGEAISCETSWILGKYILQIWNSHAWISTAAGTNLETSVLRKSRAWNGLQVQFSIFVPYVPEAAYRSNTSDLTRLSIALARSDQLFYPFFQKSVKKHTNFPLAYWSFLLETFTFRYWKQKLTELQLVQHVIIFVSACYARFVRNCACIYGVIFEIYMLYAFGTFYFKTYFKQSLKKKE